MKGLALCHGKTHLAQGDKLPSYFDSFDIEWTYIDICPSTNPDYIGSIYDKQFLSTLGTYDIILNQACPLGGIDFLNNSSRLLALMYPLLNNGGQFVFYNFLFYVLSYYESSKAKALGEVLDLGDMSYFFELEDRILNNEPKGMDYVLSVLEIIMSYSDYQYHGYLPEIDGYGPYSFENAVRSPFISEKRRMNSTLVFFK